MVWLETPKWKRANLLPNSSNQFLMQACTSRQSDSRGDQRLPSCWGLLPRCQLGLSREHGRVLEGIILSRDHWTWTYLRERNASAESVKVTTLSTVLSKQKPKSYKSDLRSRFLNEKESALKKWDNEAVLTDSAWTVMQVNCDYSFFGERGYHSRARGNKCKKTEPFSVYTLRGDW